MHELEAHIQSVKTILAQAQAECDTATQAAKEAAHRCDDAENEYNAARGRESEAIQRFKALRDSIHAIGVGSPLKATRRNKLPISDLVEIAHAILIETQTGLECSDLFEEVRARSESPKRGFHTRQESILSALRDDPRFQFDGGVWRLDELAATSTAKTT